MARVAQSSALIRTGPTPTGYDQKPSIIPSKHKIVLESVTQEKKKLRSVLSFKAEPPKGYTFIPAGNPELTNALKEFARKGNHEIYAVSVSTLSKSVELPKAHADEGMKTTPHQRAHDLSQQVHRIGFHFPSFVVAQVCAYYGIVLTSAGTVLAEDEFQSFHPRSKRLKEQSAAQERKDQITINTEARDTIKDLFPNIPDSDLNQIIKTAFQKGQGKVGTANELSLIRRAQLAVVAHIRHVYTDYDKLLRQTQYRDARNLVEKPSLRKLVEWRGDDENGKQVLEDVFREVVVISDDDDDDSDEDADEAMDDFRDVSVEIVSSNTKADHLNPNPFVLEEPEYLHSTNSKRLSDIKYVAAPARKAQRNDLDKVSRRGFSRYQAWNEAREEYRANPTDVIVVNHRAPAYSAPELPLRRPDQGLNSTGHRPETFAHARKSYQYQDTPMHSHNDRPDTFRAQDGTLYERVVKYPSTDSQQPLARPLTYDNRSSAAAEKVRTNAFTNTTYRPNRGQDLDSPRDTILPSIEGPQLAVASSQSRVVSMNRLSLPSLNDRRAVITNEDAQRRLDDIEILDLTDETRYSKKRRRVPVPGAEISKISRTSNAAPNLPLQQREPECISLLSPTDQDFQPSKSNPLSLSRRQSLHDHSNVSTFTPTFRDTLGFSSSGAVARSGETPVARQPVGQLSGVSHFSSREVLYPSTSSPRRDDDSIPVRLHSALPRGATPVDRGIQEYRAFRARERQDRALPSPSRRGRPLLYENGDATHAAIESRIGRSRQFAGAGSLRETSHQLPPKGPTQEFGAVDESVLLAQEGEYRLTRERVAECDHPLRRRSASPAGYMRGRLNYVPTIPQPHHARQPEPAPEYLSMDWDREIHRGARLGPVLVAPTHRYEHETPTAPHYSPINHDGKDPRDGNLQLTYARL